MDFKVTFIMQPFWTLTKHLCVCSFQMTILTGTLLCCIFSAPNLMADVYISIEFYALTSHYLFYIKARYLFMFFNLTHCYLITIVLNRLRWKRKSCCLIFLALLFVYFKWEFKRLFLTSYRKALCFFIFYFLKRL